MRLAGAPGLHGRFGEIIDGRRSPYDLVPSAAVARWVAGALFHGDSATIPPLLDAARRRVAARRELGRRRRLLRDSRRPIQG